MTRTLPAVTARTRDALLANVGAARPRELREVAAALDHLIDWTLSSSLTVNPLDEGEQNTVGFDLASHVVLWRAYPQKTVPAKVVLLPGYGRTLGPRLRDPLVRLITSAVPGSSIAPGAHLQVRLIGIAHPQHFAQFAAALDEAARIGARFP